MIEIDFIKNNYRNFDSNLKERIIKALEMTVKTEGIEKELSVDIEFLPPETVHKMNKIYRGVDKTTDVLSFPMYTSVAQILEGDETIPSHLGDIIINPEKAQRQALEYYNSFEKEVVYLSIHSLLHLLGYDHINDEDKKAMRLREKEILNRLE